MKIVLSLTVAFFFSISISASTLQREHEGVHTPNFCLADGSVCAHLMFPASPTSQTEAQFIAHFLPADSVSTISDVEVVLWMDNMGHGSSPVTIEDRGENHFWVTDAYFFMPGEWQVKLSFKHNSVFQNLVIPLQIQN